MARRDIGPTFRTRLRKARKKQKLSEYELGRLIGVDGQTIRRWEGSTTPVTLPSLNDAKKLLKALPVTLDHLVGIDRDAEQALAAVTMNVQRKIDEIPELLAALMAELADARDAVATDRGEFGSDERARRLRESTTGQKASEVAVENG